MLSIDQAAEIARDGPDVVLGHGIASNAQTPDGIGDDGGSLALGQARTQRIRQSQTEVLREVASGPI